MDSKIKQYVYKSISRHEDQHETWQTPPPPDVVELMNFLAKKYGFWDISFIIKRVYNIFLLAMDKNNRMIFIKSGRHPELYSNEYIMGKQLYDIDPEHFLEPLYYCDTGKYFFFANEIMNGDSLQRFHDSGKLSAMSKQEKMQIIYDLYQIFLDLKQSDVVHRDIRPENFALINGRLFLIDLQLAVSKTNYKELESMTAGRLRGLGTSKYRYKTYQWDDSYSLLKNLRFIGCPGIKYSKEYHRIYKEIKSYIGHDVIKSAIRQSGCERLIKHLRKKHKK